MVAEEELLVLHQAVEADVVQLQIELELLKSLTYPCSKPRLRVGQQCQHGFEVSHTHTKFETLTFPPTSPVSTLPCWANHDIRGLHPVDTDTQILSLSNTVLNELPL